MNNYSELQTISLREYWARVISVVIAVVLFTAGLVALMQFVSTRTAVYAADDEMRLYVKVSDESVRVGQRVDAELRIANTADGRLNYVAAKLVFDPSLMKAVSISRDGSAFTSADGPDVKFNNQMGTLTFGGQSTSYIDSPSDVLVASVTFEAIAAGTTNLRYESGAEAGETIGASGKVRNYLTTTSAASVRIAEKPVVQQRVPDPSTPVALDATPSEPPRTNQVVQANDDGQVSAEPMLDTEAVPLITGNEATLGLVAPETAASSQQFKILPWVVAILMGMMLVPVLAARLKHSHEMVDHSKVNATVTAPTIGLATKDTTKYTLSLGGVAMYADQYLGTSVTRRD